VQEVLSFDFVIYYKYKLYVFNKLIPKEKKEKEKSLKKKKKEKKKLPQEKQTITRKGVVT
jgi:hypothetical protein